MYLHLVLSTVSIILFQLYLISTRYLALVSHDISEEKNATSAHVSHSPHNTAFHKYSTERWILINRILRRCRLGLIFRITPLSITYTFHSNIMITLMAHIDSYKDHPMGSRVTGLTIISM